MSPDDRLVELDCPAKINLTLAIHGRRPDGFHDLHSIVAQVAFADRLTLAWHARGTPEQDAVRITGCDLPAGDNSVAAAIRLFRAASGLRHGALVATLAKRIPVGAGLGGGSSDAVAALKALRQLSGDAFPELDWPALAAQIGSDCPLFLADGPVLMEGRGERITPLPAALAGRLRGQPLLLFKPAFSINTAEAYRRLAAGGFYTPAESARRALAEWAAGTEALPAPGNDFERLVGEWMPSLTVVLGRLRRLHGLDARMSGSGSACFAFHSGRISVMDEVRKELAAAWGEQYWLAGTTLK